MESSNRAPLRLPAKHVWCWSILVFLRSNQLQETARVFQLCTFFWEVKTTTYSKCPLFWPFVSCFLNIFVSIALWRKKYGFCTKWYGQHNRADFSMYFFSGLILTWKAFQTKYHEGCSKFVIKKLTLFHELFAIQILNPLMCTRMQDKFPFMVFPFFNSSKIFLFTFSVKKWTEKLSQAEKFL